MARRLLAWTSYTTAAHSRTTTGRIGSAGCRTWAPGPFLSHPAPRSPTPASAPTSSPFLPARRPPAWPARAMSSSSSAATNSTSSPGITAHLLPTGLARLHLARPAKLNALGAPACEALLAAVRALEGDPACRALLITGGPAPNGRPAFCAGGDVRVIREAALSAPFPSSTPPSPPPSPPHPLPPPPPYHPCERVFQAEYNLLATLATSRLPAVSLVDGVWMGLGVGLAFAAGGGGGGEGLRVATERTLAAMPEAVIGLFPDVAFSSLAQQHLAPGVGLWMGLAGGRVSGGRAAVGAGLATHALPSGALPALTAALEGADLGGRTPLDLADTASVSAGREAAVAALAGVVEGAAESGGALPGEDAAAAAAFSTALASVSPLLRPAADWKSSHLDDASSAGDDASISRALTATLAALDQAAAAGNPAAADAAKGMRAACPLSLALTVRLFASPAATFVDQLHLELPPASRLAGSRHFAEGVRCALVDRGSAPTWPAPGESLEAISDADVSSLLAPLPGGGLRGDYWEGLPAPGGGN